MNRFQMEECFGEPQLGVVEIDVNQLGNLGFSLKKIKKSVKKVTKTVTKPVAKAIVKPVAKVVLKPVAKTVVKAVAKPVAKVVLKPVAKAVTTAAKTTVVAVKKTGIALDKASQTAVFKVAAAPISTVVETVRTAHEKGLKEAIKQLPAHNITQPFTAAAKLASQGVKLVAGKNTIAAKLATQVSKSSDKLQTYSEKHPFQTMAAAAVAVGAAAAAPVVIPAIGSGVSTVAGGVATAVKSFGPEALKVVAEMAKGAASSPPSNLTAEAVAMQSPVIDVAASLPPALPPSSGGTTVEMQQGQPGAKKAGGGGLLVAGGLLLAAMKFLPMLALAGGVDGVEVRRSSRRRRNRRRSRR